MISRRIIEHDHFHCIGTCVHTTGEFTECVTLFASPWFEACVQNHNNDNFSNSIRIRIADEVGAVSIDLVDAREMRLVNKYTVPPLTSVYLSCSKARGWIVYGTREIVDEQATQNVPNAPNIKAEVANNR